MIEAVLQEWDKVTVEKINKLMDSMPDRLKEVKECNDYQTSFWILYITFAFN